MRPSTRFAAPLAIAAVVLAAGGAYAIGASGGGTITVCVRHKGGALYEARRCAKHDKKLTWNQQGPAGAQGAKGSAGATGSQGATGSPGPSTSAYAQDQNTFVFVDSATTPATAVQLSAGGGSPLAVGFAARLHVSGVVRLRNNTGAGNMDQSGCTPQVARVGEPFSDAGPQMLGLTNGFNAFNDEATIAVLGEVDVTPGTYDARIVCVRTFSTGSTEQNKFNGDAISVIAVGR